MGRTYYNTDRIERTGHTAESLRTKPRLRRKALDYGPRSSRHHLHTVFKPIKNCISTVLFDLIIGSFVPRYVFAKLNAK